MALSTQQSIWEGGEANLVGICFSQEMGIGANSILNERSQDCMKMPKLLFVYGMMICLSLVVFNGIGVAAEGTVIFETSFELEEYKDIDPNAEKPPTWTWVIFTGDAEGSWDSAVAHTGKRSLKHEQFDEQSNSIWYVDIPNAIQEEGELFTFTVWVRTMDRYGPTGAGGRFWIDWRDENDELIKQQVIPTEIKTMGRWQEWGTVLKAPAGAVTIRVILQHINFNGQTWWDDLTVYRGDVFGLNRDVMTVVN